MRVLRSCRIYATEKSLLFLHAVRALSIVTPKQLPRWKFSEGLDRSVGSL
jgi:hypothetical protein